jgi:hypothetical protein
MRYQWKSYPWDSIWPRLRLGQHALGEREGDLGLGGGDGGSGLVLAMLLVVLDLCPPPGLVTLVGLGPLGLEEVPEGEVDTAALIHLWDGSSCLML